MAIPVYGLVLAGGHSRRMRQDKAFLQYHAQPQYLHTYHLLQKICPRAYLSCRPDQVEQFQKLSPEITLVPDQYQAIGPMAALLSAFQGQKVAWLALACDMPLIGLDTLAYLLHQRNPSAIATTYQLRDNHFPETLCTIWEPAAYPLLEQARQTHNYSLTRLLKQPAVRVLEPKHPTALSNINTPEAYAEAKRKLEQEKA